MSAAKQLTAGERLERMLSIVPFVAARGGTTVDEIAIRFDYPRDHLLDDLENVVFMVGLYPFSPDQLIEVMVDDERVWIRYAEYFERSLRLTAGEAVALVGAGQGLLAAPGADHTGPLGRGLQKLADSLGFGDEAPVEVRFGAADADVLEVVRDAVEHHEGIEIDYYAFGRDERSHRRVDPYRVFVADGHWYLDGYCHQAEGVRLFRVDRVHSTRATGESFVPPAQLNAPTTFEARPDDPRVTLALSEAAGWVADHYPADAIERSTGGGTRITLAVAALPWLERLLLRLGPDASLVAASGDVPDDLVAQAAERILKRYG